MIQRIQTIYLIAAFALCIGCLCTPIAHFMPREGGYMVNMYNLWFISQELFYSCFALFGILAIAATVVFIDIWLFKRRALQMRLATFSMILLVAWYIAYGIYCYWFSGWFEATWRPHWTAALPAAALIFLYLAFRGILKDEMLVRSLDRLR